MTLFPRKLDIFPTLIDSVSATRPNPTKEKLPNAQDALVKIFDALESIEQHIGFGCINAGDIRADTTSVVAGPGRTICLQEADYIVPAASAGTYGLKILYSAVFSESFLSRSRPVAAPNLPSFSHQTIGNTALPLPLRTQSPFFLKAYRTSNQEGISVGLFPSASADTYLALTLPAGQIAFAAGERIHLSCLFYGGA